MGFVTRKYKEEYLLERNYVNVSLGVWESPQGNRSTLNSAYSVERQKEEVAKTRDSK